MVVVVAAFNSVTKLCHCHNTYCFRRRISCSLLSVDIATFVVIACVQMFLQTTVSSYSIVVYLQMQNNSKLQTLLCSTLYQPVDMIMTVSHNHVNSELINVQHNNVCILLLFCTCQITNALFTINSMRLL